MPLEPLGSASEDVVLRKILDEFPVRTVLEIGCFLGRSARFWAMQEQVEEVWCVDPFVAEGKWAEEVKRVGVPVDFYDVFRNNMIRAGVWEKIHVLRGKSKDMVGYAPVVDLVYIDGNHEEQECARDIRLYLPKTRLVMVGDDYSPYHDELANFPGVKRAVDRLLPGHKFEQSTWWMPVGGL